MSQIDCHHKGRAWVCPHCGRSNPDVCLLEEEKDVCDEAGLPDAEEVLPRVEDKPILPVHQRSKPAKAAPVKKGIRK